MSQETTRIAQSVGQVALRLWPEFPRDIQEKLFESAVGADPEMRHQLVLNLGRPEVAAWTHRWLDTLVGDLGLDFLKWDANRPFTEAGWPGHPDPDQKALAVGARDHVGQVPDERVARRVQQQ